MSKETRVNQYILIQLGWCLLAAGLLLYTKTMVYDVLMFSPRNDFGHLYCAGFLAARGGDMFDAELMFRTRDQIGIRSINPFVYPPFFAVVLIPFSWVSYNHAWLIFNAISHAAFFCALHFLIQSFRKQDEPLPLWWGGLLFFSSLFTPLQKNYMAGQMNTFMLLVIAAAWYCYVLRKTWMMGIILGAGTAIKIAPGFLLLYLLYKRRWIASAFFLITVGISLGISIPYLNKDIHIHFLDEVRQMSYGSSTWSEYGQHYHVEPHNQAPAALWQRLLTDNPSTSGMISSPQFAKVISYITALLILILLVWKSRFHHELTAYEMALWSFGMLWIPSLMWDHYLIQLLFAVVVGLRLILNGNLCCLWMFFAGITLMGMDYIGNFDYPPFKSGILVLMMNVKLYGSILLFGFLYSNKDQPGTTSNRMTVPSSKI